MILEEERSSRIRGIRGREWGGEEEIAALATCLRTSIRVHDVGRSGEHTYRSGGCLSAPSFADSRLLEQTVASVCSVVLWSLLQLTCFRPRAVLCSQPRERRHQQDGPPAVRRHVCTHHFTSPACHSALRRCTRNGGVLHTTEMLAVQIHTERGSRAGLGRFRSRWALRPLGRLVPMAAQNSAGRTPPECGG